MALAAALPPTEDEDEAVPGEVRAARRERAVAVLLGAAGGLISVGAGLWSVAAGLVISGVCLVLWTVVVFAVTS